LLIREIILENFMSYEYARIPFRDGVNIVCGPNGAGKSSVLLAVSLALGQSYTERSRKLSDLIRWGKNSGRVSLILDNSSRGGGPRPLPRFKSDSVMLTRILRKDGKYWFELEQTVVDKNDVARLLSQLGVDPDNMLIIMHQNMVEEFTVLPSQERLRIVEVAVGFEPYRRNVLEARQKLSRILSEADSVGKLLKSAEQTLAYWKEQNDRLQRRRQLEIKRKFLERELAWAEAIRQERLVSSLGRSLESKQAEITGVEKDLQETAKRIDERRNGLEGMRADLRRLIETRMELEYKRGLEEGRAGSGRGRDLDRLLAQARESQDQMDAAQKKIDDLSEEMVGDRVNLAILRYRRENLHDGVQAIEKELRSASAELEELTARAKATGSRVTTERNLGEIVSEARLTDGHLAALSDAQEDAERMFTTYSKLYAELEEKAKEVAESREKVLEEIKVRMETWRRYVGNLLDSVNARYEEILSHLQAKGHVELTNGNDIEAAGLELHVGFKGAEPLLLDAYTQSGGERSTAIMAFLLALQHHIRSPFRAVDEYDVHMDPRNREAIFSALVSAVGRAGEQYVMITPGQLTFIDESVHVITVQNVEGRSTVREMG